MRWPRAPNGSPRTFGPSSPTITRTRTTQVYYCEKGAFDPEDAPEEGDLATLFRENLGRAWYLRVD